jgi:nucleoside-diphosphate-sugar epimerase
MPATDTTSCLIVGCGYVGTRLARAAAGRCRVAALLRPGPRAAALADAGIATLPMDLDATGESGAARALQDAARDAAVAYLAPPPDTGTTDPRLERFLAMLGEVRPACLVYVSTTGVYGDTGGASVDERSPVMPGNDRARRRVAAEAAAAQWCARHRVRCVILRVPGIYGPWRLPLERLQRGEPALHPDDAGPGNRIHVDDLVAAILAVAADPRASGLYNVTDGDHASTTEYLLETARAAGLPEPPLIRRDEAPGRISPGMLAFLLESRRVDGRRLRDELQFAPRHPDLRSGIAASLAEMNA